MRRIILAAMFMGLLSNFACTSSNSSESSRGESAPHCTEPENPYEEGTGHYAGFEWAENNGSATCGGSSQSFIEGCEEHQRQESEYAECEARKNK